MVRNEPSIFTTAQGSAYRKQVQAAGLSPDESVRRRMEFAKSTFAALAKVIPPYSDTIASALDAGKMPDLSAALGLGYLVMSSLDDPFIRDMMELMPQRTRLGGKRFNERWHEIMQEHGFCLLPSGGNNYGPYISQREVLGMPQAIVALHGEQSMDESMYILTPLSAFIDAAAMLENTVFALNAYRHHELEPVSSVILTHEEINGDAATAGEAFRRRMEVLSAAPKGLDAGRLSMVIDELARSEDRQAQMATLNRIAHARWACLSLMRYHDPDPVRHTLNALNGRVNGAYLSYGMEKLLLDNHDAYYPEDHLLFSTLAAMAFNDPFYKLSAIFSANLSGMPNASLNRALMDLIRLLRPQSGMQTKALANFLLSKDEAEIKQAAVELLNRELERAIGRPLSDAEAERFRAVAAMTPLTQHEFGMIAGIWRERFMGHSGQPQQ